MLENVDADVDASLDVTVGMENRQLYGISTDMQDLRRLL